MRQSAFPGKARPAGMALITILLLLAVVITIATAVTARVQFTISNAAEREKKVQADYAANAGLHRAMVELSLNPDWEATAGSPFTGVLSTGSPLSFEVEVINNRLGNTPRTVPGKPPVPPKRVWMKSKGLVDGVPLSGGLGQAEALTVRPDPVFNYVFRQDKTVTGSPTITFQRGKIDSYDSSSGGYVDYLGSGQPARRQAAVYSDRAFHLDDGALVDADFATPDGSAETYIQAGSVWYGASRTDVEQTVPLIFRMPRQFDDDPAATPPSSGYIAPGRYGPLVSSDDIVLGTGLYFFDAIELGNGHSLTLDASVTDDNPAQVYLGSHMYVGGISYSGPETLVNMVSPTQPASPRRLQFYCTDPDTGSSWGTTVRFGDRSRVSAVLAGQKLWLNAAFSTDVDFFGAIYGADFWLPTDGMRTHYDTALNGLVLKGIPEWVLVNEGQD